jgi:hypothetical protein
MQPTCIRVGYGAITQIHQQKLDTLGVRTLAIVETHPQRRMAAQRAGLRVATNCAEVAHLRPTFWDICVPTQYHVDILETITACDPRANILIEKPICRYTDIPQLEHVLRQFCGQMVVNENYCSSAVTEYARQAIEQLDIQIEQIVVEMTKHRGADVASGRFIQCGTVRFGVDPATSALDLWCKAHDLDNLYVVDASFMPSSTASNPALTVIANALRVADHLCQRLA